MNDKQVLIRAPEEDHSRWKQAAELHGVSMSEFVREAANAAAKKILECDHALVKEFPWQTTCLKCGKRIKG